MKVCPFCREEVSRRKRGGCPKCGRGIELVSIGKESFYVPLGLNATALVAKLEEYIGKRNGLPFHFTPDRHRWAQIAMAKKLLKRCDWDQELAEEAVKASCTDSRIYPPKTMAGVIGKQYSLIIAIAKKNLEKEQERNQIQDLRSKRISGMEAVTLYAL